jgi:hypothetical protein
VRLPHNFTKRELSHITEGANLLKLVVVAFFDVRPQFVHHGPVANPGFSKEQRMNILLRTLSALGLAASIGVTPALAQTATQIGVVGAGTVSCGHWTSWQASKDPASLARSIGAVSWVEGYITAMAVESKKINAEIHWTDSEGLATWMDNYCGSHPHRSVGYAAGALAAELQNQRF